MILKDLRKVLYTPNFLELQTNFVLKINIFEIPKKFGGYKPSLVPLK